MVIPCLMYLASVGTRSCSLQADGYSLINATDVAMGIVTTYKNSGLGADNRFYISYLSVSLLLNILLTLMIVIRLIIHIWDIRKTVGASNGFDRLFTTIATVVTMLVESYALYAVAFLPNIVLLAIGSWAWGIFFAAVGPVQVCAVSTFPRCAKTLIYHCLIGTTYRSLPSI